MNRRNFIILSTMGIVALGTGYGYYIYKEQKYYNSLHYPDVLSQIWDTETIMEIGMEYRQLVPREDSEVVLTRLIASKTTHDSGNRKALRVAVKKDFKNDNIIMIKGWVLSNTEARQCALFSIINSK